MPDGMNNDDIVGENMTELEIANMWIDKKNKRIASLMKAIKNQHDVIIALEGTIDELKQKLVQGSSK